MDVAAARRLLHSPAQTWIGLIRVAVLGGARLNREGLAVLLAQDKRLLVAASFPTAEQLLEHEVSVDVLIVDAGHDDGVSSLERVVSGAEAPAVVLGTPDQEREVVAFAELGVMGFVEREASLEELISTITSVAMGDARFPPRIATMLLRRASSRIAGRPAGQASSTLTVRERQIVELIAEGLSNKEIGTTLCIEVATVKNHVHNILEKLQVSKRSEAVARLRLIEGGLSDAADTDAPAQGFTTRSRSV